MNPRKQTSGMHFKSAQIAGVEISPNDMAQINQYALSPLDPDDIFAFKVSMAANEIDRDHEVFPRKTLKKLADLFVGKTVVKDHDHRSDNQIARIYATELQDSAHMHLTKNEEVYSELIAKCYMVKTSTNADLISEIRAGIRKEVSLGCRIGKAVCSICGTDNVKTYCMHFAGKEYDGKTCYFSLEKPQDAYELSFVAIPAQQHAGTVKSYGEKPCYQADMEAEGKEKGASQENLHTRKDASDANRLTINRFEQMEAEIAKLSAKMTEIAAILSENIEKKQENVLNDTDLATINQANQATGAAENNPTENLPTRETAPLEEENRLTVNQVSEEQPPEEPNRLTVNQVEPKVPEENLHTREQSESDDENRLIINQIPENEAGDSEENPDDKGEEANLHTREDNQEDTNRLTVNQVPETSEEILHTREPDEKDPIETEKAQKMKEAQARLRALQLAISFNQYIK